MMMMMMVRFVQIGHWNGRMGVFRHAWTDGQIIRWEVELGQDIRSRRVLLFKTLEWKATYSARLHHIAFVAQQRSLIIHDRTHRQHAAQGTFTCPRRASPCRLSSG
jgi:hypothetical protein